MSDLTLKFEVTVVVNVDHILDKHGSRAQPWSKEKIIDQLRPVGEFIDVDVKDNTGIAPKPEVVKTTILADTEDE